MKKTMKTLAALGLVCAMGTVSFAAETANITSVTENNTASKAVTATYATADKQITDGGKVYSVKITWTDMGVTYTATESVTNNWNPVELQYEETNKSTTGEWSDKDVTIDIENRSNAGIKASATYAASGEETITFDNNGTLDLGSAAVNGGSAIAYTDTTKTGAAQSGQITGTISNGKITENSDLGNITVTIEAAN